MTIHALPDMVTECTTSRCFELATTRVAGTPHCARHAAHERHTGANSPTTTLATKAHQPTPRYTDETIRQVVRQWAAIQRHNRFATTETSTAESVRTHAPALGRALDQLIQEYRQR